MKTLACFLIILLTTGSAGCSSFALSVPKLDDNPPSSVILPPPARGEFTGEAHLQDDIGKMSVFYLKLRNNTDAPKFVHLSKAVGITQETKRVFLLPAAEVKLRDLEGGRPSVWQQMVTGATVAALGAAAVGGAMGAVAGAVVGRSAGAAAGAAFFAAAGAASGAVAGGLGGFLKASADARSDVPPHANILARQLDDQLIDRASQADGFVFLPKDDYHVIKLIVTSENQDEQELTMPIAATN